MTSSALPLALTLSLLATPACSSDDRPLGGDGQGPTTDAEAPLDQRSLTTQCPVVSYAPCGGEISGTWRFVSFCPEDQAAAAALFEHPYDNLEACKDRAINTVDGRSSTVGTLSFDNGQATMITTTTMEVAYGFSDACLEAAVRTFTDAESACLSFADNGRLACRYENGFCSCAGTIPGEEEDVTTSYTLTDAQTIDLDGHTASFCQQGDVLVLDWTSHPISWRYWILER